jgi:Ca2+-binding EF-hand superfamily protein
MNLHFDGKETAIIKAHFSKTYREEVSVQHVASILGLFFPFGDASKFAKLLHAFLTKRALTTADAFLDFWSLSSRGNLEERISWAFSFLDINGDEVVDDGDLHAILEATLLLTNGVGLHTNLVKFTESVKSMYDTDSAISKAAFSSAIRTNSDLLKGILLFNGML